MWSRSAFALLIVGAVAVSSCAVADEEVSGPGADGTPSVLGTCLEGTPDCQDTFVDGELPTGGDDPLAPPSVDDGSVPSGMIVDALSVAEALAFEGSGVIAVEGFVVRVGDVTLLCDALAESFPPQCGGDSVSITNPDVVDELVLEEEGTTQWSPDLVTVLGEMSSEGFTIDPTSI